jgi:hypothetical protein
MSADRDCGPDFGDRPATGEDQAAASGDDERESREEIAEGGEPQGNALGNADGAN